MASISFNNANSGTQIGINNGPINYLPQPEDPPEHLFTVPFPDDPDFVSRTVLLEKIHEKASIPGSRIGLIGIGGVGKTQLAIEYCYRSRQQDSWVLWVHASNAARCKESLRDLADRARIPGRQERDVNIFQLVGNWLQDAEIGNWILVLDNVDDDELLRNPATRMAAQANSKSHTSQPPLRYLLKSSKGSIVITSRNRGVALNIAGPKNLIEVQPMDRSEALALIQTKLDGNTEEQDLIQLVEELEFMPLAIVQAASYIAHHSSLCSVSQYLEKLRQSDRQAKKLLMHDEHRTDRDWEAKNSILLTWQISFDHIQRIRPSAADLLSVMSFFDRQGISRDLLRVQEEVAGSSMREDSDTSSEDDQDDDFEEDIITLRDYFFIAAGDDSTVFTLHRLVQLTVRIWLKTYGQYEECKEKFIKNLYAALPENGENENWEKCRSLSPHVESAMLYRPKSQDALRDWGILLHAGAWYTFESGGGLEAKDLALHSREQMMETFGAEDNRTLISTAILVNMYWHEGQWEKSEPLQVQLMETCKAKFGEYHPDTLTSMDDLALIFVMQGRYKEAEQLQQQVQAMETRKINLGTDHPDTLQSTDSLAPTPWKEGR